MSNSITPGTSQTKTFNPLLHASDMMLAVVLHVD